LQFLLFAIHSRKFEAKFRRISKRVEFLSGFAQAPGAPGVADVSRARGIAPQKADAASEVAGRRVSNA